MQVGTLLLQVNHNHNIIPYTYMWGSFPGSFHTVRNRRAWDIVGKSLGYWGEGRDIGKEEARDIVGRAQDIAGKYCRESLYGTAWD